MKKVRWILFAVFLFCMMPVSAYGKELSAEEAEIKKEITKRAGYDKEEEAREWEIIKIEEKDGSVGYFVSTYYTIEGDGYDKQCGVLINYIGDVWAVKADVYTKLSDNVQLYEGTKGGIELLEMEGRSCVLVRERYRKKRVAWYWPNEDSLYSFEGNELVCYLDNMTAADFDKKTKILTAYSPVPLGSFEYGYLNAYRPKTYRETAFFFRCKDGVFQEIVGEPCTKEEALKAERELRDMYDLYGDNIELFFYKLPGIGYYANVIACDTEEETVRFQHDIWPKRKAHTGDGDYDTPWGYRYQSWLNRAEEEKEIGRMLMEKGIKYDISELIPYEDRDITARFVKKGDTLWSIAKVWYDDGSLWKQLYERNKKTIGSNPALIKPGMILEIKDKTTRKNE